MIGVVLGKTKDIKKRKVLRVENFKVSRCDDCDSKFYDYAKSM